MSSPVKIPVSVVIIARDEAANIERCIKAVVDWVDQVIVVDSGSTDNTVELAKSLEAEVLEIQWASYGSSRNSGVEQAKHDWILALDADEEVSPALKDAIIQTVAGQPTSKVYKMARLTNFCGQWIKHCGWYPDWKERLYHKAHASWNYDMVHEELEFDPKVLGQLGGDLLHYSFPSMDHHERKIQQYSELGAKKLIAAGKTSRLTWKRYTHALWRLIRGYLLQGGFLEGKAGWVISMGMAREVWLKYKKAAELI